MAVEPGVVAVGHGDGDAVGGESLEIVGSVVKEQIAPDQLLSVSKDHVVPGQKGEVLGEPIQLVPMAPARRRDDDDVMPLGQQRAHPVDRAVDRFQVPKKAGLGEIFINRLARPGDAMRSPLVQVVEADLVAVLPVVDRKPLADQVAQDAVHIHQDPRQSSLPPDRVNLPALTATYTATGVEASCEEAEGTLLDVWFVNN